LELKELFEDIFLEMKQGGEIDIKNYWKKINLILYPIEE
jgi:hypothetical protein